MYAGASLLGLATWALLLFAATQRRGLFRFVAAAAFVVSFVFVQGEQTYFHDHWNTYLTIEASVFSKDFWGSIVLHYLADLGGHLRCMALPLAVSLVILLAARRVCRARRRGVAIAVFLLLPLVVGAHFLPARVATLASAPPDVLWFQAFGGMIRTQLGVGEEARKDRPRVRSPLPLPALEPAVRTPRNILFVLLESTRADAVCVEHDPDCKFTPHTNELLPHRFPFTQMRALDSTTVISTVTLFGGLGPHEDRESLHAWPWLFDYARAAGFHTAYWTSQDVMFGNLFLWRHGLGVSSYMSGRQIDPLADRSLGPPENLLADRVIEELRNLEEPFFAVLHLSNTHFPYYVNPRLPQPFQTTGQWPGDAAPLRRRYQNSIWQADMHLARVLRELRSTEAGRRTAIVYTSDHGEAFEERGHGGHIFSLYDEEIRVPAWIDAPTGILTDAQAKNLHEKKDTPVFHVDIAPTILDLMGVWENPAIEPLRRRMPGTSLLGEERTTRPLLMTNCSALWTCAYENWGAMQGNKKLFARAWDQVFMCFDVEADPHEREDLGAASCGNLLDMTLSQFGRMPTQNK